MIFLEKLGRFQPALPAAVMMKQRGESGSDKRLLRLAHIAFNKWMMCVRYVPVPIVRREWSLKILHKEILMIHYHKSFSI